MTNKQREQLSNLIVVFDEQDFLALFTTHPGQTQGASLGNPLGWEFLPVEYS
jgi:hypothetical protein